MHSRAGSVPKEPKNSTGYNPDTLREIREQIRTNNNKHEAVSNFNRRLGFFNFFFICIQLVGFLGWITYFFIDKSEGNQHAKHWKC